MQPSLPQAATLDLSIDILLTVDIPFWLNVMRGKKRSTSSYLLTSHFLPTKDPSSLVSSILLLLKMGLDDFMLDRAVRNAIFFFQIQTLCFTFRLTLFFQQRKNMPASYLGTCISASTRVTSSPRTHQDEISLSWQGLRSQGNSWWKPSKRTTKMHQERLDSSICKQITGTVLSGIRKL